MELIEGELRRFAINKGEGTNEMYNRLKSLLNQIWNYGSSKWTDHKVIKLKLRYLITCNATLVTLLCENPRYEVMTLEEVLSKSISHEMMVKDYKHIEDLAQGNISNTEPQVVAFKATSGKEEGASRKELPIDPSKLDDEEIDPHHQKLSANLEDLEGGLQSSRKEDMLQMW